jgi:tRNA (cmo5U34)-methyltransferase
MTAEWIPTNWTFKNKGVAERFDDHVRETLPWYDLATHGAAHLIRAYTPDNGLVYDIGASTGNIARSVADTIEARQVNFIGIEPAKEMSDIYDAPGELFQADARYFDYEPFDVAILFLTLMFIPVADREELLDQLHEQVRPGGAIIIVDKAPLPCGYLGSTIHRWTMKQKQIGGITAQEIAEKELSLIGVQRPLDPNVLELHRGYTQWLQVGEFFGMVYEKPQT